MNYQINVDEAKQLIGDMALEIYALRRDNVKLSEELKQLAETGQKEKVSRMPDPRQILERERELNG